MIHVIASITVKQGCVDEFLALFNANVPNVLAEKGCIEYGPTVDVDTTIEQQEKNSSIVTIVEKWESVEHLLDHMTAPHMLAYRERVADIVENLSLKVLQQA